MAMKETERSLTLYFVVMGAISVYAGVSSVRLLERLEPTLLPPGAMFAVYLEIATRIGLGLAFIVAGATLKRSLLAGGTGLKNMLAISGTMVVVNWVVGLTVFALNPGAGMFACAIGVAITVYLYRSVTRLSAEARNPPPARVA